MDLESIQFKEELFKYLKDNNITSLTEVQEKVIPSLLRNENVVAKARTGTGKTFSYLLSLLNKADPNLKQIQTIIFLPTRELSYQIYLVAKKISEYLNLKVSLVIGGSDFNQQVEKVKNPPQILIGTPQRIAKLFFEQKINLKYINYYVLDEVDMLINFNLLAIISNLLVKKDIKLAFFSATISPQLISFAKKYIKGPISIYQIENFNENQKINHYLVKAKHNKFETLTQLINDNAFNPYLAFIFTSTNEEANQLYQELNRVVSNKIGFLSSTLEPRKRIQVLKQIHSLQFEYVVVSDLMARGIDVEGISHIISYSFPKDLDYYQHRAGRTGRFNNSGDSYLFVNEEDLYKVNSLVKNGFAFKWRNWIDNNWEEKDYLRTNQKQEQSQEIIKIINKSVKLKGQKNYRVKMKQEIKQVKKNERSK